MKDSKHYNFDFIKSLNRPYQIIYEETKEIKMDSKLRDVHILNKDNSELYVIRGIPGDIVIRKNRIELLEINTKILLPAYLEGIKVLID